MPGLTTSPTLRACGAERCAIVTILLARPNERRFNRAKYSYNQKRKIVGKAGWIYTIVACCTGHDQAAGMLPDLS